MIEFQRRGPRSAKERRNIGKGVQNWHKSEGRDGSNTNTKRNIAIGSAVVAAGGLALLARKRKMAGGLPRNPITDPARLIPPKSSPGRVQSSFFDPLTGKNRKRGQVLPGVRKGQEPPVTIGEPTPGLIRRNPRPIDVVKQDGRSNYINALRQTVKGLKLFKRYTANSVNFSSKEQVSGYTTRDGRRVNPFSRLANRPKKPRTPLKDKIKNYAATAIISTAAYRTLGRSAQKATGQLLNTNKAKKIGTKALNLVNRNKVMSKLTNSELGKNLIPLYAGTVPAGIVAGYATKKGADAIGWSVDRNRKNNEGKIKTSFKNIFPEY